MSSIAEDMYQAPAFTAMPRSRTRLAVEIGRRTSADDLGEEFERIAVPIGRRAAGRDEIETLEGRLLDLRIRDGDAARCPRLRLARAKALRPRAAGRDHAIGRLGEAAHLVRDDVAGNDEDRVLRRVEAPIVGRARARG